MLSPTVVDTRFSLTFCGLTRMVVSARKTFGRRIATTAMQTEIPRQIRMIQDLRRRTRSKHSRICTLSAEPPEMVKTGCSFKTVLQMLPRPVKKFQTRCKKQALFHYCERHPS